MNKRLMSAAIMMALIITLSVFASLAAATTAMAAKTTTTTITASNQYPAVGQAVTFTATLKSGTKPLSGKSITIYHYLNGVKYTDTTKKTNTAGKITLTQSFGSSGKRTYYASFAGETSYSASKSTVKTINVKALTGITLIASITTPAVNQKITFTSGLFWWNPTTTQWVTVTTGKPVTIYHYLNGVRYTDTTKTTNTAGQITLTKTFGSAGQRTYFATFAGDMSYSTSRNGPLTITVH